MWFLVPAALGATLTVDGTTYPTVQAAVDASSPGDTVLLPPGLWSGDVVVAHDLTLAAQGAPGSAVLSGISPLTLQDATIAVEGISLVPSGSDATGLVITNAIVSLVDVALAGFDHGGMYATDSTVTGLRVDLVDNAGSYSSAPANQVADGTLVLTDSTIRGADGRTALDLDRTDADLLRVTISGSGATDDFYREAALDLYEGVVVLTDVAIVDGAHALAAYQTDLTLIGGTLARNWSHGPAGLRASGGTLSIDGTVFEDNEVRRYYSFCDWDYASAVQATGTLDIRNALFQRNTNCAYQQGSLGIEGPALVEDVVFVDGDNLAVEAPGDDVTLRRVSFGGGVGIHLDDVANLLVEDATFEGTYGINGQYADLDSLVVRNAVFDGPDDYRGLWLTGDIADLRLEDSLLLGAPAMAVDIEHTGFTATGNRFCFASSADARLSFEDTGAVALHNNVFGPEVEGAGSGAFVFADAGSSLAFENNVVVGGGSVLDSEDTIVFARNNALLDQRSTAFTITGVGAELVSSFSYNGLFDSAGELVQVGLNATNTTTDDPLLVGGRACATADFVPAVGSPWIDGGDPVVLDPDGSRSDIGLYGGPEAFVVEDADGDGASSLIDCDDEDADRYPGAVEVWYDGVDQDCDGADDDQDGDGFLLADDCDDTEATANPDGIEVWYDGIDQDCDGNDADQDGDGVDHPTDCDDTSADVHPGVAEVWYDGVDQDCDGNDDDQDGDGFGLSADCDDADPDRHPEAVEVWYDGVDQDCDGNDDDQDGDGDAVAVDCDDTDAAFGPSATEVWYDGVDQTCDGNDDDQDGDGVPVASDCDDTDASRAPGLPDFPYDGVDQDCDGADDTDLDGDGFSGVQAGGDDCDDGNADIHPLAAEVWYDGVDQDCDGNDDDQDGDGVVAALDCDDTAADAFPGADEVWYDGVDQDCDGNDDDQDGDGSPVGTDCDDTDAAFHPDAVDIPYDGIDQDCDGLDNLDQDGDGYDGVQAGGTDCDDGNDGVNPGTPEAWYDGVDQDCDGNDDDQDGDGIPVADDCDDQDASIGACPPEPVTPDGPTPPEGDDDADGGCSTAPAGVSGILVLAGLLVRRRR